MFHRHGKKVSTKPLKDLIPIVAPSQLLLEGKRQDLINQIKEFSGLESSPFENLCLNLIHSFINHCQSLPDTANSYYALPGGFLDHALNRTEAALSLFRHFIIQPDGAGLSEEQKLWVYALFSAGILQGIGKLQLDYRVELFDVNGQAIKQWNPLLENMATGSYYHFEFLKEGEENFRRRLNLLLARLLMPAAGFSWITSNQEVLAVWLALLNEDMRSAGTLGAILIRADAIAIQRYFNQFLTRGLGRSGGRQRISTFVDSTPEHSTEKERLTGLEFIQWLTLALESGKLILNKAPLPMVPGGLIISDELFRWFMREHPEYKNWQAIQKGFLSLGLHSVGADGSVESRFEQANTRQMQTGIVFAEYAVALPEQVQLHNPHTGKTSTISATELIHKAQFNSNFNRIDPNVNPGDLNFLTAAGKWLAAETKPVNPFSPGVSRG